MKKLELKHLAGYLPYGLKVEHIDLEENTQTIDVIETLCFECVTFKIGADFYFENSDVQIKPLLRPLSDLTKEIEHNGEKFVPLEVIARMIEPEYILIDKSTFDFNVINESIGYDKVFQLRYKTDYDNYKKVVMLNFHEKEKCFWHTERIIPFSCIEKLLEWHFDIHNLIKNNLAIELK